MERTIEGVFMSKPNLEWQDQERERLRARLAESRRNARNNEIWKNIFLAVSVAMTFMYLVEKAGII